MTNAFDAPDPMSPAASQAWFAQAREQARDAIAHAQARFGLGTHARYAVDLAEGTIRFFDAADVERVRADVEFAGSWSPSSQSWLWGWENASMPATVTARLEAVRAFGEHHGVDELRASVVEGDADVAWTMAAAALRLLDAQAIYRAAGARSEAFLLMFAIRVVA